MTHVMYIILYMFFPYKSIGGSPQELVKYSYSIRGARRDFPAARLRPAAALGVHPMSALFGKYLYCAYLMYIHHIS